MKRPSSLPINLRRIGLMIGVGLLVLVVIDFNTRLQELNNLSAQAKIVRTQATQAMQTQIALQTQVGFANSDSAAEQYARTDGHMVQAGDIPVVPLGDSSGPPPVTPTPAPSVEPKQNWEIWWWLFFGKR